MTGDASHKADENHLTRFTTVELQRHLRNRLRSGHALYGNSQHLGEMSKPELEKLHQELHRSNNVSTLDNNAP